MLLSQRKCKFVVADEVLGRELLEIRAAFGKVSSTCRKRVITRIVYTCTHEIPHIQTHAHKMHTHTPCKEANRGIFFGGGREGLIMQDSHTHT